MSRESDDPDVAALQEKLGEFPSDLVAYLFLVAITGGRERQT